jgi:lipopolysaccharide transport system ATP-binding protein
MTTEVISVQNLGKKYKRYANKSDRIIEWLSAGKKQLHEPIWVLKGLNFSVKQGESLGIIGQNGAGKSTLLKIITGSTLPTEGSININGRIAALLELGMGFHADFSGRQNAITACQIMGISLEEIHQILPTIEEFSELGEYINQPLRIYSSGMQMRLAFSVATAIRPEILIVDEALSVGDTYFQHKSMSRIRQFREQGTTLLFVSHDPGAVKSLCDRAILLDQGLIVKDAAPDTVFDYYNAMIAKKQKDEEIKQIENEQGKINTRSGNKKAEIISVEMLDHAEKSCRAFLVNDDAVIRIKIRYNEPIHDATLGIMIRDRLGNDIFGTNTHNQNFSLPERTGEACIDFSLQLNLGVGNYSITIASHTYRTHLEDNHDWWDQAVVFQIIPNNEPAFVGVVSLPVKLAFH